MYGKSRGKRTLMMAASEPEMKNFAKITSEVRNTYTYGHKTKFQEVSFQYQLIQLKFN